MRRFLVFVLACVLGTSAFGQAQISLRSTDKAECVKSDYRSLQASFSFSGLETSEMNSERGVFSTLTMPNTVVGGNEGDPQIPVVSQLIAVPFGASPTIRVIRFSTQDYDLDEYGIHTLMPRQPDLRKDQQPEDVEFVYHAEAYQTRGLATEPTATGGGTLDSRPVALDRAFGQSDFTPAFWGEYNTIPIDSYVVHLLELKLTKHQKQ